MIFWTVLQVCGIVLVVAFTIRVVTWIVLD